MTFAQGGENSEGAPPRRTRSPLRRRIDQLRVLLWFCWIQHRSRHATLYALEKQLVADGFTRNADGALSHRHRVARYAQGKHVPRPDLVTRAEALFPGSRALLEHVYWQILDPGREVATHRERWLSGLGPQVQRVLFRSSRMASEFVGRRQKTSRRLLRQLENLGSFDALAATAFLLREALADGRDAVAYQCAESCWVLLLLILSTTPFIDYLPGMTRLAGDALLDQVHHRGEQVAIASAPTDLYERLLRGYCLGREDAGKLAPDWASWVRERLKLIRGTKGFDLLFAFRLPTEATDTLRADPTRYREFLKDAFVRWKALDYITDPRWAQRPFMEDWATFWKDPHGEWPALES